MDRTSGFSGTPPIAESPSNPDNNDGQRPIPEPQTASCSSGNTPLSDRSAIRTEEISPEKLKALILQNKFSNDVLYQVKGTLDLSGCTSLTALPKKLSVSGNLNLSYCIGLRTLSGKLFVGGSLFLPSTALETLPESLFVEGNIDLTGCTSLRTLPSWITTMGVNRWSDNRIVNLVNTGLSDELIERLRNEPAPGMQFYFSRSAGRPEQRFSNLQQGFDFWRKLASSDLEIPELQLQDHQATDLVRYLGRLTVTADYKNQACRPVLAQRVMAVMSLLAEGNKILEDALRRIDHALSSCNDRITLALDDLETLQLLASAEKLAFEKGDESKLMELGLQMMRLDEVKKIAREHMKTLNWVDEVEVELAFQIGVRQKLDLPGSTQNMIFRGCAHVSDQDVANAVERVKTHCSEDTLDAYLEQWAPWQKYQRLHTVLPFDQLKESEPVSRIDDCPFSAKKTNKMVIVGECHLDYDSLVKSYLENGNNPFTHTPLDWSSVERLIEDPSLTLPKNQVS